VPRGLPSLAGERTALRHWPPATARRLPPPRPCRRHFGQQRLGETALERYRPIKAPLPFLAHARATLQSAAPAISFARARDQPATLSFSLAPT
jgi:hypothetical protein